MMGSPPTWSPGAVCGVAELGAGGGAAEPFPAVLPLALLQAPAGRTNLPASSQGSPTNRAAPAPLYCSNVVTQHTLKLDLFTKSEF